MPSHPPELVELIAHAARLKITPEALLTLRAQADARAAADRDATVRAAFAQHLPTVTTTFVTPLCDECGEPADDGAFLDRGPDGGAAEPACAAHADPRLAGRFRLVKTCLYCTKPVHRGGEDIDGEHAHTTCLRKDERGSR